MVSLLFLFNPFITTDLSLFLSEPLSVSPTLSLCISLCISLYLSVYPLKASENQRFYVFSLYRKRPVASNLLETILIYFAKFTVKPFSPAMDSCNFAQNRTPLQVFFNFANFFRRSVQQLWMATTVKFNSTGRERQHLF